MPHGPTRPARPDKPARPPAAAGLRWLAKALYTTCWPAPWPWPGGGRGADRPSRVNVSARRVVCSPMSQPDRHPPVMPDAIRIRGRTVRPWSIPTSCNAFGAVTPRRCGPSIGSTARLVFAVAYKALGSRDLAEEATQQTFVKAWRAAATYDPARELGPWLATIARRTAIDLHRREARRPAVPLDEASLIDLPDSVDQSFDVWAVRSAIDRHRSNKRSCAPAPRVVDAGGDRRTARRTGRNHQVKVVPRPPAAGRAPGPPSRGGEMTADPRTLGRPSAYTWAEVTT